MARSRRSTGLLILLIVAALVVGVAYVARNGGPFAIQSQSSPTGDNWPTYMHDGARSGFNPAEVRLSPDNAAKLKLIWKQKLGNVLAAQPIVKGDTLYEGSWDGYLYALSINDGSVKWKVDLGRTTSKQCVPETAGITSAAALTDKALFVGGGDQYLYALNPQTGETLWKFVTGDNSEQGGNYNWTSPLVYSGRVYYGTSSFCDKPFPHGEMWGIDASSGKANQHVDFVPPDQKGGGLWTSPAVDESTGNLYATIGSGDFYIPHSYSIARLDPGSLSVVDAWQIPVSQQVFDGDWGTTPTLFKDRTGKLMVGAAAKNGYYYAFHADNISAGPTWSLQIADGGQCPQCGEGVISSSAYAYDTVYAAGGYLSLGQAQKFAGTVHALDPSNGAIKWIHPTNGSVIPALAVANGLVVAAGDDTVEVFNAATGELLWEYATEGTIYAAPTITGGVLYVASTDGFVYAFSAGPYQDQPTAYKVDHVGSNPPGFTAFRTPMPTGMECFDPGQYPFCINGAIWEFFKNNGGDERFGPPITPALQEAGRIVQYFRNAVIEEHQTADGLGAEARFGKLDFRLFYYTPKDEHFDPTQLIAGATFFPETHHNLAEPFLSYWKAHGDIANLGYPVSEPFDEYNILDGQTRRVQYFERSRLEIVTDKDGKESVALGALGLQRYKQRYGKLP
jgi:polyvinyl alcohol dehydrogenase (cytochrome)